MSSSRPFLRHAGALALAPICWSVAAAQEPPPAAPALLVKPVAERIIQSLPDRPLYWQVERFATAARAAEGAASDALFVDDGGATWRFTLGAERRAGSTGTMMATIGPVPKPAATRYLLRINRASGPPGSATPVHTHPGSEAFYVLEGRLCQRTEHATKQLDAGRSMNGDMPGMVMQIQSCGTVPLDQFVMFVVDADKPFSSPASFKER